MAGENYSDQLRLRIFAGPNGSGKSTIIQSVSTAVINGKKIDFGIYINADDIASALLKNKFSFHKYRVKPLKKDINFFAQNSGLLTEAFSKEVLQSSFQLTGVKLNLINKDYYQETAQLLARYLRECMLRDKRRFTFETVFSHPSNLDIMQRAVDAGYKVYLYFVSTESPEINKFRVKFRVTQKGHDVPEDKIESRYYRSLHLLPQRLLTNVSFLTIPQMMNLLYLLITLRKMAPLRFGIPKIKRVLLHGLKNIIGIKAQYNRIIPAGKHLSSQVI